MREKNLSKAGQRMGLSQPAMSHALNRLRRDFQDPLFVRVPGGVAPTPFAERIAPEVDRITSEATELFQRKETFNPAAFDGKIKIVAADFFEHWLIPRLVRKLPDVAPGLTVVSQALPGVLPKIEMEKGMHDIALVGLPPKPIAGYDSDVPDGFRSQKLYDEKFVCVARKNHPALKKGMTLDAYTKLPHALITRTGDLVGMADVGLKQVNRKRKVVVAVSSFLSAGWLVADSDLILTAPSRLVEGLCEYLPLAHYPMPFKMTGFTMHQIWHERTHNEPHLQWFRKLLFDACQGK